MIRRMLEFGIVAVALAALVLSMFSFFRPYIWRGTWSPQWSGGCSVYRGRLFLRADYDGNAPAIQIGSSRIWRWEPRYYWKSAGFKLRVIGAGNRGGWGGRAPYTLRSNLWLPFWMVLLSLSLLPALTIYFIERFTRYLRRKRSLCVKCAYNLTGNVSGVCPECGETT